MIHLAAADTIAGVAETASEVTCTLFLLELSGSGTVQTYIKDQQQLANSAATIYTAPGSTETHVRSIHVVNTSSSHSNTFQLFVGGTAAANAITPSFKLPPSGMAVYEDGHGWRIYAATGGLALACGTGRYMMGARASLCLTESAQSAYSLTGIKVEGLDLIVHMNFGTAGLFLVDYSILYESSLATTGISLGVNYTGSASITTGWMEFPGTGTLASTGAASMVASGATGQVHESFGFRALSTTSPNMGATVSVDAAGSVMLARVIGALVTISAGRLELWYASDTAGAVCTIRPGSTLRVTGVS